MEPLSPKRFTPRTELQRRIMEGEVVGEPALGDGRWGCSVCYDEVVGPMRVVKETSRGPGTSSVTTYYLHEDCYLCTQRPN